MTTPIASDPILRGGDRWLFKHMEPFAWDLPPSTQIEEMALGYEDRGSEAMEFLKLKTVEEAMEFLKSWHPQGFTPFGFAIGQEEDRSAGFPIRFARAYFVAESKS